MAILPAHENDVDHAPRSEPALVALLDHLRERHYRFVTPTPATHARVIARTFKRHGRDLRDAFGWSLPCDRNILPPELLDTLLTADVLVPLEDGRLQSRYRVSTLGSHLILHSAYPTNDKDSVFFGPDSYRFAELVRSELFRCPCPRGAQLIDIGTGAGVGAIVGAELCPGAHITMTDVNAIALQLARFNARTAGVKAEYALGADLDPVEGLIDIALANPPYMIDDGGPDYRNGGGMHGARVAYQMAVAAIDRLSPDGRFILYTGSAIINGEDRLRNALADLAAREGCEIRYWEIDPDVFGEELEKPAYSDVERIAIVGSVVTRSR